MCIVCMSAEQEVEEFRTYVYTDKSKRDKRGKRKKKNSENGGGKGHRKTQTPL